MLRIIHNHQICTRTGQECVFIFAPFFAAARGLQIGCASEGVQGLLFDSFLWTEIPKSLKYGAFAGEMRLLYM
jgi:hypothetical protein